jgi:hypothetical protein
MKIRSLPAFGGEAEILILHFWRIVRNEKREMEELNMPTAHIPTIPPGVLQSRRLTLSVTRGKITKTPAGPGKLILFLNRGTAKRATENE